MVKDLILFVLVGVISFAVIDFPIKSESFVDTVKVEDVDLSYSWSLPKFKRREYNVELSHGENNQYYITVDNHIIYNQCKDKIGETLKAKFVKQTYEDGRVEIKFIDLKY